MAPPWSVGQAQGDEEAVKGPVGEELVAVPMQWSFPLPAVFVVALK